MSFKIDFYFLLEFSFSPKESFSPESGGRVKPSTAMEAMRTQGTIREKKFLFLSILYSLSFLICFIFIIFQFLNYLFVPCISLPGWRSSRESSSGSWLWRSRPGRAPDNTRTQPRCGLQVRLRLQNICLDFFFILVRLRLQNNFGLFLFR